MYVNMKLKVDIFKGHMCTFFDLWTEMQYNIDNYVFRCV